MAQYDVTHACGHTHTHQLYGKHTERDRRMTWLARQDCPACERQALERRRQEEAAKASAEAKKAGLPALAGTDRQVAWAEQVRAKFAAEIGAYFLRLAKLFPELPLADPAAPLDMALCTAVCDRLLDAGAGNVNVLRAWVTLAGGVADAGWWIDHRDAPLVKFAELAAQPAR